MDAALVEETVKRLSSHKGVQGIVILNSDAVPIRSTLDNELAVQYAALVSQLTVKARSMVRELAAEDDLQFLRLRSKKHEIMVAPCFDKDHQYSLVVVQVSTPPPLAANVAALPPTYLLAASLPCLVG